MRRQCACVYNEKKKKKILRGTQIATVQRARSDLIWRDQMWFEMEKSVIKFMP